MQFSQLYTESIAEFLDAKQVLFINQKGLDALDDFFQHHLEEVKSLFLKEVESSRLLVTKDCQLFLPDNNNKEIVMGPLPKAVFLLFLRHPETNQAGQRIGGVGEVRIVVLANYQFYFSPFLIIFLYFGELSMAKVYLC